MSIGAAIGAGIAGSIGNAIGNAIGGAFSGGSSNNSNPSKGRGSDSYNSTYGPGPVNRGPSPVSNGSSSRGGIGSSLVSAVGKGLGSAISGFGSAYANAAYNSVGQSAQGQFNALAGVDAQGGRNARDFMQNLYGPDVSPWDWLQGNANNQGSIQASQQSEDRNKLKVSERIVDKQNATQRYVSDNAVKATKYAADTSAGASRYGSVIGADATRDAANAQWDNPTAKQLRVAETAKVRAETYLAHERKGNVWKDTQLKDVQIAAERARKFLIDAQRRLASEQAAVTPYSNLYSSVVQTASVLNMDPETVLALFISMDVLPKSMLGTIGAAAGMSRILFNLTKAARGGKTAAVGAGKGKKLRDGAGHVWEEIE